MLDLGIGFGLNQTVIIGDDFWIEQGLPHSSHFKTPTWHIDLTMPVSEHWRVRTAYVDPGTQSVSADIVPDAEYDVVTHRCLSPCPPPYSHWYGWGSAKGISLGMEWHRGGWEAGGGIYRYRSEWREIIDGTLTNTTGSSEYHTAPTFGVGFRKKWAEFRLDTYMLCLSNSCIDRALPGIWKYYWTLTFTVRPWGKP